jgi:hypothetical protein
LPTTHLELRQHLGRVGEPVLLVLREHDDAVGEDVELADPPGLHVDRDALLLLDLGRETRGAGLVVSGLAVLDDDAHALSLGAPGARRKARLAAAADAP